jgi:hypothetical protein
VRNVSFLAYFCCLDGMFGPQKHHFMVMAGKSKGMNFPKIFLTRPSPADYHLHFRSFLWFLEDDIHPFVIDASFFLMI